MKKMTLISCILILAACFRNESTESVKKRQFNPIAVALNDSAISILTQGRIVGLTDSVVYRCYALLDSAIRLDPQYVNAYINKISIKRDLGQYSDAINIAKELLAIKKEPEYIVGLGLLYQISGDSINSKNNFQEAYDMFLAKIENGYATNTDTINYFYVDCLLNGQTQTLRDIDEIVGGNSTTDMVEFYKNFIKNMSY